MKIYTTKITDNIDQGNFNKLIDFMSDNKKKRVNRFYHFSDSLRMVFSDLLIRMIIIKKFSIDNEDIEFLLNDYGKPHLKGFDDFHFNISHSGEWIACAIDEKEVGIDIEKINHIELDIAKRFFTKNEYIDLINKPEQNRIDYFYDLWTLKESYIKARGMGLSIPLNSFSFKKINEKILFQSKEDMNKYFFRQYDVDCNYKLSVCSYNNNLPECIVNINMDEVIKFFLHIK